MSAGFALSWECLTFLILGLYLKTHQNYKIFWALLLGLCCGLGNYISILWGPIFAMVAVVFIWAWFFSRNKSVWKDAVSFLAISFLSALPLVVAAWHEGTGRHFLVNLNFDTSFSFFPYRFLNAASYFTCLFWGTWDNEFRFTSLWGGFFNPLEGAWFFLGVVELYRFCTAAWMQWLAVAFLLFLLPGLLSANLEMMRIVPSVLIVIVIAALGLQRLLLDQTLARRSTFLIFSLVLSASFTLYNFAGPYHLWQVPGEHNRLFKSEEKYRAFTILRDLNEQEGPGFILTEFTADYSGDAHLPDQTLRLASYPFNAVLNARLSSRHPSWVAVLFNEYHLPFLSRRFPDGKFYILSKKSSAPYGELAMCVVPTSRIPPDIWSRWLEVHQAFLAWNARLLDLDTGKSRDPLLSALAKIQPLVKGDPFLESCLLEKAVQCFIEEGNEDAAQKAIERAQQVGYPCRLWNLYLGTVYQHRGANAATNHNYAFARKCFNRAGQLNPRLVAPPSVFRALELLEKAKEK